MPQLRRHIYRNQGTIFYGKRTAPKKIMETLALIAEGSRVSSVARITGHKEDTIVEWLRNAARHSVAIEAELLKEYRVERGQLDAMWSYVGNKGEKRVTPRQQAAVSSVRLHQIKEVGLSALAGGDLR